MLCVYASPAPDQPGHWAVGHLAILCNPLSQAASMAKSASIMSHTSVVLCCSAGCNDRPPVLIGFARKPRAFPDPLSYTAKKLHNHQYHPRTLSQTTYFPDFLGQLWIIRPFQANLPLSPGDILCHLA
eukprot:1161282-Pelagomonas_calceolata.AAC.4